MQAVYLSSESIRRPSMSKRQARMGGKLGTENVYVLVDGFQGGKSVYGVILVVREWLSYSIRGAIVGKFPREVVV